MSLTFLPAEPAAQTSPSEKRVALVVGSNQYEHVLDLDNPANDARAIAGVLRALDFEVVESVDVSYDAMVAATRTFGEAADGADVTLFFYAGHAIQYRGQNYLVPTDAKLDRPTDIDSWLVNIDFILRQLQAPTNIIVLDACRDNPFENLNVATRAATGSGGLAPLHASRGTFIAYATEPNRVAYDGIDDDHSPFTRALLDHIETPGLEIATLMKRVRNDVFQTTQQRQVPWEESSLFSDFFFIPESASEPAVSEPRVADLAPEQAAPEGEITPPRPEHPPEAPPLLNPLEVSNKATQAQLAMVPQIRDPNGDQLWVQILELPTRGAVRVNRKQVKIADRMTLDQLMSGYYYPGRSPPVGPAGKIGFQVYDQQFAVDTGLPIVIVKENEPPVFDIQELVVATLGRGPQGLNIKPPTDPDGDSVFVTIAALPRAGKLMMRGLPLDVGVSVTTDQIAELRYVPPDRFVDDPGVMKLEAHDGSHSVLKTIKLALNRNPIMTARSARAQHRRSRAGSAAFSLDLEVPKDPDGDPLKIRIFGLPDNGDILVGVDSKAIEMRALLSPEETGGLMFRPKSEGRSHLTLEITDGRGGYFRRRVELIVGPANRSPRLTRPEIKLVAMAGETMPLSLDKPVDPDGDSLSVQIVSVPENGEVLSAGEIVRLGNVLTAEQLAKLQFRASPSADAEPAELRFVVFDAYGAATDGLVEIAVNHAPTGERVTKAVLAGGPPIDVVPIAPFDADGDALEIRVQSIPVVGRIMVNERVIAFGDRLTIDDLMIARFEPPSSGFFGPVGTFDYLIDDGRGGTATGSTTIIINSPPAVQANPRFEFDLVNGRSQPLAIPPPFDREGDPLEIVVVALPTQGSLTAGDRTLVAGDVLTVGELRSLRITIVPTELNAGAAGAFVYTVRDAQGAEAEGSIDIAVRAPNQQPTAPSFDVTVQVAGGPVALFGDQTRQPVDPDDDELTVIIIDVPWSGDVDLNGRPLSSGSRISAADMANILYWPGEDAGLAGAFVYVAEDERSRSAEGVVTITLNRPPTIAGRVGFGAKAPLPAGEGRAPLFKQDPAAEAGLLPLPTDDLGDVLEIEIVRMTDKPGLTLWLDEAPIGSGEIVRGADSFARIEIQAAEAAIGEQIDLEFVIRDSAGAASTVTLAVSVVAAPNVAPIFLNQGLRTVMENEGPQDLDLTPPTDSDPLRVFLTDVPQHGSLMLAGEAIEPGHLMSTEEIRQLQFDPGSAGPGIAGTIILTAVDDKGASGDGQFIIRIEERPNRPPILPDQPDADMVIGVGQLRLPLKPPVDPDDDPLTIRISAVPQNGELRFGDRPAEVGMLLAADDFNSAYFTPHQDRPLVRGGQSFLDFSVSDGRGEGVDGKVRISTRLHDCDRLASTADNFDSVSKEGVLFEQLDSAQAIPACEQALRDYGEIERFRFQLARAQHAGADIEDAWQNYSLAAQSGDIAAQYNLAMLLLDDDLSAVLDQETGDVDGLVSALDLLRTACEADWTKAQTSFAAVVINRQSDLPEDMTGHYEQEAMRWLEVAVKEDDPAAMAALGMVYAEGGLGIEPDLDKAKGLLERAAGLDNTTAKTGLGYLYASGRFGDGNVDQAVPWFEAAAEQNDASAMVSLGALYSKGHGVPKDAGRAIGLYESACAADAGFEDLVAKSVQQMTPYETILGIQTLLTSKGYKPGPSDGIFGRRTADAARLFAKDNLLVVDDSDRPALLLDIMNCK